MSAPSPDARAVGWMDAVTPGALAAVVPVQSTGPANGSVRGAASLPFGNVALSLPSQTGVKITDDGLTFANRGVAITRSGFGPGGLSPQGPLAVDFQAGRVAFPGEWDPYDLFTLFRDNPFDPDGTPRGGDLRYFADRGGSSYAQFVYPTLPAASSSGGTYFELDIELDPAAPFDGERTRMRFQTSIPSGLTTEYATTASGRPVGLTPLWLSAGDRAGFYFGVRPGDVPGPFVYLAPLGPFELGLSSGGERVMCGLSGLEFIAAQAGDIFEFVPSRPALGMTRTGASAQLERVFTTSWVLFRQGAGNGRRAYFGQPSASVNYGAGVVPAQAAGTMKRPAAVASLVRELPGAEPFPLVPYGATMEPHDGGAPDPAALLAFERSVLTPFRGQLMRTSAQSVGADALGAPPAPSDPVFADAGGRALAGGATTTPQGFVVELNDGSVATAPAGTWKEVRLARSAERYLAFDAAGGAPIDSWLAATLLRDQLFLVMNDWTRFPMAQRELLVDGFNFRLAPDKADPETILVFKFSTAKSLTELIDSVPAWAEPDVFVRDVTAAQGVLKTALKIADDAKGKPDDPFGYFRDEIASQPSWTGLLAFNGAIDGNGMPPDLQMLFAGIDGELRAHHFGVEVNRVERTTPTAPEIKESALFAVIHYQSPVRVPSPSPPRDPSAKGKDDFAFEVQELNVGIRKSAVTEFHAKVGVTINAIFGRAVALQPPSDPANTIELTGQYQKHGDVGTVGFSAPAAASFSFAAGPVTARVLDTLTVTAASLVPVASKPGGKGTGATAAGAKRAGDGTEIRARVTLGGSLSFAPNPFPGVEGLDLFSYGSDGQGIGYSGIGLDLSCRLNAEGQRAGATTIALDLTTVVLADNPQAVRAGSLVKGLPVSVTGLLSSPDGLDNVKLGALPLKVVELTRQVTAKPPYALQFKLPLGSLGGLADVHASIDAALILGWGPSTVTPDDDGAGIFVQLPALSAGAFGFNLQGLLKTTFGDANLMKVELKQGDVYVMLFNNVALSLLGLRFPPRVITDFILFAGSAGAESLGWSLAATELPKDGTKAIGELA